MPPSQHSRKSPSRALAARSQASLPALQRKLLRGITRASTCRISPTTRLHLTSCRASRVALGAIVARDSRCRRSPSPKTRTQSAARPLASAAGRLRLRVSGCSAAHDSFHAHCSWSRRRGERPVAHAHAHVSCNIIDSVQNLLKKTWRECDSPPSEATPGRRGARVCRPGGSSTSSSTPG